MTEIPLGSRVVGDVVNFDVPAGTVSITIVEQAKGTGAQAPPDTVTLNGNSIIENTAVPDKVRNPSGTVLYDDNPPSPPPTDPSGQTVFFASGSPLTGAFTIPNTSQLLAQSVNGLPSGKWSFVVNDFGFECAGASNCTGGSKTSTYDVRVVLKGGAPRTAGVVDVAFYLVGVEKTAGVPFTAQDATKDPSVARMVASVASLYSKAGICLGNVTFYDVPAWAAARFGTLEVGSGIGPCDELDQMFTLSVPGNQLNFFLVGAFSQANTPAQIAGIDGTIPGPSGFGGTIHSGAVIDGSDIFAGGNCSGATVTPTRCGADEVAYIAAHEGGHWMGLYHTTESGGDFYDPLADTAKCPCDPCVPQASRRQCGDPTVDPVLNGANCTKSASCGGGENLMFWLLNNSSTGNLSCEQGGVMRANPVVH
ncbi:MAG TPA: hypothetical protein VFE76_03645 [Myxococcales bacterium]|nr:hypothetical protein [Myxococcales bacterium]